MGVVVVVEEEDDGLDGVVVDDDLPRLPRGRTSSSSSSSSSSYSSSSSSTSAYLGEGVGPRFERRTEEEEESRLGEDDDEALGVVVPRVDRRGREGDIGDDDAASDADAAINNDCGGFLSLTGLPPLLPPPPRRDEVVTLSTTSLLHFFLPTGLFFGNGGPFCRTTSKELIRIGFGTFGLSIVHHPPIVTLVISPSNPVESPWRIRTVEPLRGFSGEGSK